MLVSSAWRDYNIKQGHGYLIMFSINNRHSFESAKARYHEALTIQNRDKYPAVLVG